MSKEMEIRFTACFAQKMNAIQIGPDNTRLTIDVPASEQLNAVGLQALLQEPLEFIVRRATKYKPESHHVVGTTKAPTKKHPKGEWSYYWQQMHRPDSWGCNFTTFPDLQEMLEVDAEHVHEALRARFKVDSLTSVSPEQFEQFVRDNGLSDGLITMSRNAAIKAEEKTAQAVSS